MTEVLLARAVRTLPVIHQQHWVKAALALERLRTFFKDRSEAQFQAWVERTDWDSQPAISGPLYAGVIDPVRRPSGRWMRQLQRGMVASAAPSALPAIREQGVEAFILGFRDEISESPGYLGHALSVLMGFREAWPKISNELDRTLFLERLLEFCATSLFYKTKVDTPGRLPSASFSEAFEASLKKPSFFGHHLLTLAWLTRNEGWFGQERAARAYAAIIELSQMTYADAEDNVILDLRADQSLDFSVELERLLTQGPRDVHAVTLGDALLTLFQRTQDPRLVLVCQHFRGGGTTQM